MTVILVFLMAKMKSMRKTMPVMIARTPRAIPVESEINIFY